MTIWQIQCEAVVVAEAINDARKRYYVERLIEQGGKRLIATKGTEVYANQDNEIIKFVQRTSSSVHDQKRKERLIKSLNKAREDADIAHVYLSANDGDPEDVMTASMVRQHIAAALELLGVE